MSTSRRKSVVVGPGLGTVLVCLAFHAPSQLVHGDVDSLLQRATVAHGVEDQFRVCTDACKLSDNELRAFVQKASRAATTESRLIAAAMLSHDRNENDTLALFGALKDDEQPAVQQMAWITSPWTMLSEKQQTQALESRDALIRACSVLKCESKEIVADACFDQVPFVRAIAIRRLGKISAFDGTVDGLALEQCLVDHDQLVRSNALLMAIKHSHLSKTIGSGLVTDNREMLMLESVLALAEEESAVLREKSGLSSQVTLGVIFLRQLQIRNSQPPIPPLGYKTLLVPLDQKVLIGPAAANLMVNLDSSAKTVVGKLLRSHSGRSVFVQQMEEIVSPGRSP